MKCIKPLELFGSELNRVQSPSRYIGGEIGIIVKEHRKNDGLFNFAVAFPDVYEIAMSNLAVKIIYNGLNAIDSIRCERVFSPDCDFEELLKEKNVPLYTLETGMPLCSLDMIGFSVGYELGVTQVLAMLESGRVPLLKSERKETDPIVFAGGCGVTNPAPFADFFDAVFIGEAENELFELVRTLAEMKKKGSNRSELIEYLKTKPFIWTEDKKGITRRHVQADFGLVPSVPDWYPLPSSKPVQDHGVVEIMRGCPNGCRFCHAGLYYRPTRIKNIRHIINETDHLVFDCGYTEISLNSLSSADFPDVSGLLDLLNERYKGYNVSFQLPSLKVNSMSLDILEKLSTVRKSGLTFAVETPDEMWQLSLNKEVYAQHLESIIREAKNRGWSSAKFYFMVGLPVGDYFGDRKGYTPGCEGSEEKAIVDFLIDLQARTKIQCNVNVGVFIPKPHTPYQWVTQISPELAAQKIEYIWQNLPRGKFKMGRHNFDATILEGLFSRGDRRAGKVILSAFKKGARFDAWDDHLKTNMEYWNEAFSEASYNVKDWIYRTWSLDEELPWDSVTLGTPKPFLLKEWQKSRDSVLTPRCESNCTHKCGICSPKGPEVHTIEKVESISDSIKINTVKQSPQRPECNIPVLYRCVFSFTRTNGGEYVAYLSQLELFHKAILMSQLPFVFTAGFNPLPRLEFATPMTLGLPSEEEVASALLYENVAPEILRETLNRCLPSWFRINEVLIFPVTNLRKRESLSSGLWGGIYRYSFKEGHDISMLTSSPDFSSIFQAEFSSYTVDQNVLTAVLPVSDKKLRTLMESVYGVKWFEAADAVKMNTLAESRITGWTARDEENWRKHVNPDTEKTEDNALTEKQPPVSYFKLYGRIAEINRELIEKRAELTERQNEFYRQHPDIKEAREQAKNAEKAQDENQN